MSEQGQAKRDGYKLQPNSGRGTHAKGDAQSPNFVIDYKEASRSFTLNTDVWAKICTDAAKVDINKMPMLKVIFGRGKHKVRLCIVSEDIIEEYERLKVANDGDI